MSNKISTGKNKTAFAFPEVVQRWWKEFILYLNIVSREHRQFYNCCIPSKLCDNWESWTLAEAFLIFADTPDGDGSGKKSAWQKSTRGPLHYFINQVEAFWKMFLFGCGHLFFGVNRRPVAGFCERKQWTVVAAPLRATAVAPVRRLRGWCRSVSSW